MNSYLNHFSSDFRRDKISEYHSPFVVQFVGYKNSGKTTLICRLIERLSDMGLIVGTVKHDAHDFEVDHPNTDTWLHRQSGAHVVAITSPTQTVWMEQQPTPVEAIVNRMQHMDVVFVEGFKQANYIKIALLKNDDNEKYLLQQLTNIVATVISEHVDSNVELNFEKNETPVFHRDQIDEIVQYILALISKQKGYDPT